MNLDPSASYIELHVPLAESERQFLLFAVQAAVKRYRELHGRAELCRPDREEPRPAMPVCLPHLQGEKR